MLLQPVTFTAADIQMVEDHIAQGEQHVVRQEQLITRLRSQGHPTAEAESLLSDFQGTLRQHRDHHAVMRDSLYPRGD